MEINKNSFLARYYMFMFDDLPKDFCTLFWNTLIATIFLPITIVIFWIPNWSKKSMIVKILYGIIFWILLLVGGIAGGSLIEKIGWTNFLKMSMFLVIPLGFIALFILILTIVGIGIGICYIVERGFLKLSKIGLNKEKPSKLSIIWSTIRNKYCTKINWK